MIRQIKDVKIFNKPSLLILEYENKKYSISVYYKNDLKFSVENRVSFKNVFKLFKKEYPIFEEISFN